MEQPAEAATMQCLFCDVVVPAHAWFCPGCGVPVLSAEKRRAAVGQRPTLPGYTVFAPLGWGASSIVYRARQDSLGREVAVKLIRQEIDDVAAMRRFEREARIIASLSGHQHVVTIYDVGRTSSGQPFLVTELLDRGSVSDVLGRHGALDAKSAVAVGRAVADALGAAHARGILHRDVKPGNVLVGSRGQVKLADFGVARLMAGHSQTTTASIAFTPEDAAPEVLRGEQEGPASDVYGLASTVVTALSGLAPFARRPDERIEAMMWRKMVELPPPLPASVPAPLAELLQRCLATSPADRPPLDEVVAELAHIDVSGAALGPAATVTTLRQSVPPVAAATELAVTTSGTSPPTDVLPPPPAGSVGAPDPGLPPGPDTRPPSPFVTWGTADSEDPIRRRISWRAVVIGVTVVAAAAGAGAIVLDSSGGGSSSRATTVATTIAVPPSTEPAAAATVVSAADAAPAITETTALATTIARVAPAAPSSSGAPTTIAAPAPTAAPSTIAAPAPSAAPPTTSSYVVPATAARRPVAPATTAVAVETTSPAAAPPESPTADVGPIEDTEAIAFVRNYYDELKSGNYDAAWPQLTPEFITARNLTFDRYVNYWKATSLTADQLHFTPGPRANQGRVRFAARYSTPRGVIEETDEITLERETDDGLAIADQRIVG